MDAAPAPSLNTSEETAAEEAEAGELVSVVAVVLSDVSADWVDSVTACVVVVVLSVTVFTDDDDDDDDASVEVGVEAAVVDVVWSGLPPSLLLSPLPSPLPLLSPGSEDPPPLGLPLLFLIRPSSGLALRTPCISCALPVIWRLIVASFAWTSLTACPCMTMGSPFGFTTC